jgi:seryl-tRNA(Sec) selenium transferase
LLATGQLAGFVVGPIEQPDPFQRGSGALFPTAPFGLGDEPTVPERIAAGPDVVCFSGDKLLGGPQAGILVGRREAIDLCRRHALLRALRVDKVTLAGLLATLAHHERGEALREIPVWRAIAWTEGELRSRAEVWRDAVALPGTEVMPGLSAVGGGTLPGVTLPTFVEKKILETDPGARGNTATNVLKPAKINGGFEIHVPLFINQGDIVKIDTRTGEYADRVSKK